MAAFFLLDVHKIKFIFINCSRIVLFTLKLKKMKGFTLIAILFFAVINSGFTQGRANDIPVSKLPADVKEVLVQYVNILRTSNDLDDCAERFLEVAGGSLVNEDGETLRNSIQPFSLKKDFNNVKFYQDPIKITRVNVGYTNGDGFGPSALRGKKYKIWIDKADKKNGMPAPISIVVPEGHETIKTPKVIGIGSL
jgi:hypothetical protein